MVISRASEHTKTSRDSQVARLSKPVLDVAWLSKPVLDVAWLSEPGSSCQ